MSETLTLSTPARALKFDTVRSRVLLFALVVVVTLLCWIGLQIDPTIADENDLIEDLQAFALGAATLVHAWRFFHAEKKSMHWLIHGGLALLMYSFLMRELEIRELDAAGELFWHRVETGLRFIGWTAWVVYLACLTPRLRDFFRHAGTIARLPATVLALLGAAFMVAGWPFDKEVFHSLSVATSAFMEETLELNGYLLLLVAAFSSTRFNEA
jgi:hypothetical protein